jgi:anti-sigma regulatory factor (Ser/Thr protein kinase)
MQRAFKRELVSLEDVFAFIQKFFAGESIDLKYLYSMNLAAEELFTNMVKYNPGNSNEIVVGVCRVDDELRLSLTDFDVGAFDPTKVSAAAPPGPLKHRKRGGLGLCLVRQMMDAITYDYENRQSKITVTKKLR